MVVAGIAAGGAAGVALVVRPVLVLVVKKIGGA
jgi:hypothetical protein